MNDHDSKDDTSETKKRIGRQVVDSKQTIYVSKITANPQDATNCECMTAITLRNNHGWLVMMTIVVFSQFVFHQQHMCMDGWYKASMFCNDIVDN